MSTKKRKPNKIIRKARLTGRFLTPEEQEAKYGNESLIMAGNIKPPTAPVRPGRLIVRHLTPEEQEKEYGDESLIIVGNTKK